MAALQQIGSHDTDRSVRQAANWAVGRLTVPEREAAAKGHFGKICFRVSEMMAGIYRRRHVR